MMTATHPPRHHRLAVRELVWLLREEYYFKAANTLQAALATDSDDVALTVRERTAILDVLDDPPADLAQLRAVLMNEHVALSRAGLIKR